MRPASASPKGRSQGSSRGKASASAGAPEDVKTAAESAEVSVKSGDLSRELKDESAAIADLSGKPGLPGTQQVVSDPLAAKEGGNEQAASAVETEEPDQPMHGFAAQAARSQLQALQADRLIPPESRTDTSLPGSSILASDKIAEGATAPAEDPAVVAAQLAEESRR